MSDHEKSAIISLKKFKKAFRGEESKFRLYTALKITGIFCLSALIIAYHFSSLIYINYGFFKANGLAGLDGMIETFFNYNLRNLSTLIPWFMGFLVFIFFIGLYLAGFLIRPFIAMGDSCYKAINHNGQCSYNPPVFFELRLLARFSEVFFQYINLSLKEKKTLDFIMSEHFRSIRKPQFEKIFFIHLIIVFIGINMVSAFFLYQISYEIFDQLVQMAFDFLRGSKEVKIFLENQKDVLDSSIIFALILQLGFYIALVFNLFSKVSGAAFGIFATFRSFAKGNYNARIHLIGFSYIRTEYRLINKYLDYVQERLADSSAKVSSMSK